MSGAEGVGLGAGDEGLGLAAGARYSCELSRFGIDSRERDAARRLENSSLTTGDSGFHEAGPNWQRRLGAREPQRLVVVVSDPDDGEEIRRESYEPGIALIVRGAGLAGCDRFETAGTNLSRRALIDDASHHVGYQICACRMHHGVAGGLHGVEGRRGRHG